MIKQKKINIKNLKRKVARGVVHIKSSFNNNIISVTDLKGNVISWSSAGACGFKGSRKGTPFAAQTAAELALKKAVDQGMKQVEINVSGPGSGREMAIRSVQNAGMGIILIRDVTRIAHNGCRPTKKRRI
uniref:Small ribosomal subunit protein uS11c n=1 Tax=Monomorphina parapyrum TaxID=1664066 RepID=A0A0G3VI55_9EUGL|nr:ribosomal protein S11 [Monomorphina parapyrum]AKL78918.1 ribosomal protein S11 [Monomorphina parapyrum]